MKTPTTLRGRLLEAKPRELSELEHRRARTKLLAAAAEQTRPRAPGPWMLVGGVVAATAILVFVNAHRRPMKIVAVVESAPSLTVSAPPVVAPPEPAETHAEPSPAPVPPPRVKTVLPGASFEKAFADFEKGNYGVADLELESFLRSFPTDARAEDAAYLRAVARSRLGDREGAALLARSYLDAYPNGLRRLEAERIAN